MTALAVSAAVLVGVAALAWATRTTPTPPRPGPDLHRIEADARIRYYAHVATADEIAERCARLEHPTGRTA